MLLVAEVLEGVVGVAVAAVGSLQMMKGITSGEVVGVGSILKPLRALSHVCLKY
ncbi:hypothetical protein Hdeb2414_s0012g00395701 [Helianthus debilis subsp. tardiflorus]